MLAARKADAPSAAPVTAAAPGAPPTEKGGVPRLPWSQRSPPPAVAKPPSKPVPVKEAPAKLAANLESRLKAEVASTLAKAADSSTLLEALRSEATPVDIHQHVEIDYTPNEYALGDPEALARLHDRKRSLAAGAPRPTASPTLSPRTPKTGNAPKAAPAATPEDTPVRKEIITPAAKKPKAILGLRPRAKDNPTLQASGSRERSRSAPALRSSLTARATTLLLGRPLYPTTRYDETGTWVLTHQATAVPRTPHRLVRWHRPGTYTDLIETDVDPWSRPESEWLGGPQSHQIDIHPDTQLYRLDAGDSVSSGATPPPEEEDDDGASDGQQPPPELDLDFYCPILQGNDTPPEDVGSGTHPPTTT